MRRLTIIIYLFLFTTAQAQFIQKGRTLEYNGLDSKSIYRGLVQFNFKGAASTVNENGLFSLKFNQLCRGNVVKQFDIEIVDKEYVLFNKKELSRWVLTSEIEMEVLLCKKSRIDNLMAIYSKNYIGNLNNKYDSALAELKKANIDKNLYEKELHKLRTEYETSISIIKSQSVMFAYVDERKLDSLELLKRKYILENNLSAAYEIGKQINYSGIAEDYMSNIATFNREISANVENLLALIENFKIHIENIKQQVTEHGKYSKEQMEEIKTNLQSLVIINDFVYTLYRTKLRCTDDFLDELKNEYGQSLLQLAEFSDKDDRRQLLEQSAELGNAMAMYQLGELTSDQFDISKQWFLKCIKTTNDVNIRNMAEEELETFPDFMSIVQGDTLYCHVLSEKNLEISICDFHPNGITKYDSVPLKIPSFVKHNKRKYSVKKIAKHSFRNCCIYKWADTPFFHSSEGYRHYDTVIFQEPLETIGESSFACTTVRNVILPKSLRTIKRGAFEQNYAEMRRFDIPEGVEQIEEEIYSYGILSTDDTISLSLPSTLKFLHKEAFGGVFVDKIELNPSNIYFQLINGVLYSADTTSIYSNIIPYDTKEVFVPDNVSIIDIHYCGIDNLQKFIISNKHSLYKTYEDVVYTSDFSRIVSVPKGYNTIILHQNLTDYNSVNSGVSIHNSFNSDHDHRNIIIPKQLNPNTKYALYIKYINDSIRHWPINEYRINLFGENLSNPIDFDKAVSLAINVLDSVEDSVLLTHNLYKTESEKTIILYHKQLSRQSLLYGNSNELLGRQADSEIKLHNNKKAHELYRLSGLSEEEISEKFLEFGCNYWLGKNNVSQSYKHALDCFNYCISIRNNPLAAYYIGIFYENGYSVEPNIDIAIKWYKHSVEWGASFSGPSYNLGFIYYYGKDVQQDYTLAKHYFEIAANLTNADAYNFLGTIYNRALSVDRDINKSISYYEKAIEKGDKKYAPFNLGAIYYHETGYKDYAKAYLNFKIAAENSNADAMNMIAYMKALAYGTNHNLAEALYYINKAITLSPDIINYWDSKGEILLMSDRIVEAKQVLREMIAKDSIGVEKLKPESNFLKAIQYKTREEIFQKLFELGDSINTPYLIGNIFIQNKNIIKAKTYYEIASEFGNKNAKVALFVIKQIINDGQTDWSGNLIKKWQHTPITTNSPINEISFTLDGNRIVGDSRKGKVGFIWSLKGDELIYKHEYDQKYDGRAFFSPTGEHLIIVGGNRGKSSQIWRVDNDSLLYSIDYGLISILCISNNGMFYLSFEKDGNNFVLRLREMNSGRIVFSKILRQFVTYAGFSSDDDFIVAIADEKIYIWNSKTGDDVQTYDYKYVEMDKAAISPDNSKMICFKKRYHWANIWSIISGELINSIRHNAGINDVSLNCTSQYVASASDDSTAAIWNLSTGEKLKTFYHKDVVKKLHFSPDGKILATSCSNFIYLWDVENGSEIKSPMIHDSTILDFNFSPDGKIIVSSTNNNICRLWDVESGSEITSTYFPDKCNEHSRIDK